MSHFKPILNENSTTTSSASISAIVESPEPDSRISNSGNVDLVQLASELREQVSFSKLLELEGLAGIDSGIRKYYPCPFHEEGGSRQLVVDDDLYRAYCHECQWSGDIFAYLQKRRGINFRRAVKLVADNETHLLNMSKYAVFCRKAKQPDSAEVNPEALESADFMIAKPPAEDSKPVNSWTQEEVGGVTQDSSISNSEPQAAMSAPQGRALVASVAPATTNQGEKMAELTEGKPLLKTIYGRSGKPLVTFRVDEVLPKHVLPAPPVDKEREKVLSRFSKAKISSPAQTVPVTELAGINSKPDLQDEPPRTIGKTDSSQRARKAKEGIHLYSRALALKLNPNQPDITAAVIYQNLRLWQKNRYQQTLIDDRRYCFRSLTELEADHPYFTRSAIHKALIRLEKALGDEFLIKRDKDKLWFCLDTGTEGKDTLNRFYVQDAVDTGSVKSAILLANLKYALSKFKKPKRDQNGNAYVELSPKKLCPILNFSEDTISRSLKEMCENGHLVKHPGPGSFYTLKEGFVEVDNALKIVEDSPAEVHDQPAEVNCQTAELHKETAEVHSQPAEIHTPAPFHANQLFGIEQVMNDEKVPYSNECGNEDGKQCVNSVFKESSRSSLSAAPQGPSSSLKGLELLKHLAEAKVQKMRSSPVVFQGHARVTPSQLPYDFIDDPYNDLPYDQIATGHRTFHADVKAKVKEMREWWKVHHLTLEKDDAKKLEQLFTDNPQLEANDLYGLYLSMEEDLNINGDNMRDVDKKHKRLLSKVKTPKAFLKYLPQIVTQSFQDLDLETHKYEGDIDEPFASLDYSYLGEIPNSGIISFDHLIIPKEFVESSHAPDQYASDKGNDFDVIST